MSISNGQPVDAANSNSAWMSRTKDTNTTGKVDLENVEPESGSSVLNAQKSLNGQASFSGADPNGAKDQLPAFASNAIGSASDNLKVRQDEVQTQVEVNQANIATNVGDISANTSDISDIRTTTGTADGDTDMGVYTSATVTDNQSTKQNIIDTVVQVDQNASDISTLQSNPVFNFKGNYDVVANSPVLVDGTGTVGDAYKLTTAGTRDFGSGNITFIVGDLIYYDGAVWFKDAEAVQSVAGKTGIVTLVAADITDFDTEVSNNVSVAANTAKVSAGGSIDTHSDVDTSTVAPTDQQVLTWNNANSEWEPADSAGGGGSGQGGINYIINSNFEDNIDDIQVVAPMFKNTEIIDPIRGTKSLKISMPNSITTASFCDIFMTDIDPIDEETSAVLTVSFDYYTDANFSTGDIEFVLRRQDATVADIKFIGSDDPGQILQSLGKRKFTARVQVDNDANTYTLRMNVLSAPGIESTVWLDNIIVGPDVVVPGAIAGVTAKAILVTASQALPAATNTLALFNFILKDDDSSFSAGGSRFTAPRDGTYTFSLSLNYPGAVSSGSISNLLSKNGSGLESIFSSELTVNSGNGVSWTIPDVIKGDFFELFINPSVVTSLLSSASVFGGSSWSIIEHTRNGAMFSTSEASLESISTHANNIAPTGTIAAAFNVAIFGTIDSDDFSLYNTITGQWTAPRTGKISVTAFLNYTGTPAVGKTGFVRVTNVTTGKNVVGEQSNGAAINVKRPTAAGMLNVSKGDIVEVQSWCDMAAPAFGTSNFSIAYRPDFTTFSVFNDYGIITAKKDISTNWPFVTGWGNLTSIDLEPGTWRICGQLLFLKVATASNANLGIGISIDSGASTFLDYSAGDNSVQIAHETTGSGLRQFVNVSIIVKVTVLTTYYLKGLAGIQADWKYDGYKIEAEKRQ